MPITETSYSLNELVEMHGDWLPLRISMRGELLRFLLADGTEVGQRPDSWGPHRGQFWEGPTPTGQEQLEKRLIYHKNCAKVLREAADAERWNRTANLRTSVEAYAMGHQPETKTYDEDRVRHLLPKERFPDYEAMFQEFRKQVNRHKAAERRLRKAHPDLKTPGERRQEQVNAVLRERQEAESRRLTAVAEEDQVVDGIFKEMER